MTDVYSFLADYLLLKNVTTKQKLYNLGTSTFYRGVTSFNESLEKYFTLVIQKAQPDERDVLWKRDSAHFIVQCALDTRKPAKKKKKN